MAKKQTNKPKKKGVPPPDPETTQKDMPVTGLVHVPQVGESFEHDYTATEDKEFDPIRKAQEEAVSVDYKKLLENVMDLHAMTKTSSWRTFWQWTNDSLKKSREEIEIAEKPRDILFHQVTIRQLKAMRESFARPVQELNDYMNHNPLFVKQMPVRAEWNAQLGQVQIKKVV